MFEKTYKSRYHYAKAIQYDGTAEMSLDLVNEYLGLREYAGNLYIDDTNETEIWPTDWLLIQNGMVKAVISDEYFDAIYTRVDIDEYNYQKKQDELADKIANTDYMDTERDVITDVDLIEIDKANEEKNNS